MKISREQLEKIAHLARLKIEEKDIAKFERNFNDIIDYVNVLQKVEVPNDLTSEDPIEFEEVLRPDNEEKFPLGDWQSNLDKKQDNHIATGAIFNDKQR